MVGSGCVLVQVCRLGLIKALLANDIPWGQCGTRRPTSPPTVQIRSLEKNSTTP